MDPLASLVAPQTVRLCRNCPSSGFPRDRVLYDRVDICKIYLDHGETRVKGEALSRTLAPSKTQHAFGGGPNVYGCFEASEEVHDLSRTLDLVQSLLLEGEPASSLAETAYRQLRARIIGLQLGPGELLTETELQTRLGLGRTPIREALNRLIAERLVVVRSRRGVFVSELRLPDLGGLYEVRAHLEGLAAWLAATRTDDMDGQLKQWQEELDTFEAASLDYEELLAIDYRWHQLVYALSRNHYLQEDLTRYLNLSTRLILAVSERGALPLDDLSTVVGEFRDLFDAIRSHNPGSADRVARHHVEGCEAIVRRNA